MIFTFFFLVIDISSHSISTFNFLRSCHTIFYSGCTILYSHQKCTRIPTLILRLILFFFFRTVILTDMKWYPIMVWTSISLMSDVENFFIYQGQVCKFSLEKCLFKSFVSFKPNIYVITQGSSWFSCVEGAFSTPATRRGMWHSHCFHSK